MIDKAWLSILGLYKYDNTIFNELRIPQKNQLDLTQPYMQHNVENLSKDTLMFKILMDLAELPLVYTDPETVKYMIGRWSTARTPVWLELWKTTLYQYNPIWNKDGVIEETRNLATAGNSSGTASSTTSGTVNNDKDIEHKVTGYDTDSYAADTKDIVNDDTESSESTSSSSAANTAGTENETIRRVEQGNIGVTTTMQMIKEQRDIATLDMYQVITDEFKKQFCICVY